MPRNDAKPVKSRRWLLWALPIAFVFIVYNVMTGPRGLMKVAKLRAEKQRIQLEIDSLEAHKRELLEERERLLNDTTYLEKLARKELGMARPGEKVYRFVTPSSSARDDSAASSRR